MKITFIYPNVSNIRAHDAMQPLAIAVLAGLTPPDVELTFCDERIEADIPYDVPTDLVALTVQTFSARRAYQIAHEFRRRGVPVVVGGFHPTFMPEEALRYADVIVLGDAEDLWPRIVRDAGRRQLQRIYRAAKQPTLEGVRFDRRLFQGKHYVPLVPVQFGRGCRYACDYCAIHSYYGTSVRHRPVREVVAEIESLDAAAVFLIDDNIALDPAKAEELFRALGPVGVRWCCQVSIDVAWDERLLAQMATSGCIAALVGFESLDERNLSQMKKAWNLRHGSYAEAIERFRDHGIMVFGSFVIGYDHDTVEVFDRILAFALESRLLAAIFAPLVPMPGSGLYDRFRGEDRLIRDPWWLHPDHRYLAPTFHPRGMTADELAEGARRIHREFYRASAVLSRVMDRKTHLRSVAHLAAFAAVNLTARREIRNRHGHRLGADVPLDPAPESSAHVARLPIPPISPEAGAPDL